MNPPADTAVAPPPALVLEAGRAEAHYWRDLGRYRELLGFRAWRDIKVRYKQTVLGAAVMVQESDRHPAALRDDVTTPAGCTIGALLVLEDGKIRSVLARAVEEARNVLEGTSR